MPLDYDVLRFLWWALLGILLIGFAVLDGYDLGTAMLLPFVSRTDAERRQVREAIEPNWEGHQVWLIVGAGCVFAAWPPLYAASFSGFYVAMILALWTLILRPVGFNFRDKLALPQWRLVWDWALAISGFVPALVFGIAFGNLLEGVPFGFDADLRLDYTGGFFELLNPFALFAGLVSVAMLAMHGGTWLALRTDGAVAEHAARIASLAGLIASGLFVLGGIWIAFGIEGYAISGTISHSGPSNPLAKSVVRAVGAWLDVYAIHRPLVLAPFLGMAMPLAASLLVARRAPLAAFLASGLGVAGIVATAGISMFPFLLPSSTHPSASLTVWDASSSALTLFIMLIAVGLILPIVVIYTGWALRVMRGTVRLEDVEHGEDRY